MSDFPPNNSRLPAEATDAALPSLACGCCVRTISHSASRGGRGAPWLWREVGWPWRQLSYSFGPCELVERHGTVTLSESISAIRRALSTWEDTDVGIEFTQRTEPVDMIFGWYDAAADPECLRFGCQLGGPSHAHADLPPPNTLFGGPPLPVHFHAGTRWSVDGSLSTFDIESVALHEIGHCLGLFHGPADTIMEPTFAEGSVRRTLDPQTRQRIERLYGFV